MLKDILKKDFKSALYEALLLIGIAILLFGNQISNYTTSSYIIKTIFLIIFITILLTYIKHKGEKITIIFNSINFRNFFFILITLVIIPALTLFYSKNYSHGFAKTLNMIFFNFPLLMVGGSLLRTNNDLRISVLYCGSVITGVVFSFIVIFFYPFDHSTLYSFSPERLSHVTVGRILGICYLIILFFLYRTNNIRNLFVNGVLLSVIGYASYLTALRASVLGLTVCLIVTILFHYKTDLAKIKNISVIISVLIALLAVIYTDHYISSVPTERFNNMELLNYQNKDGAINARIFLYTRAVLLIKENPVWGAGYGGFAEENSTFIVYPHNIFLEAFCELGILGGTLIFTTIIMGMYNNFKISKNIFILTLYALILSQFSKDLTTNGLLIFLAGTGMIYRKK